MTHNDPMRTGIWYSGM